MTWVFRSRSLHYLSTVHTVSVSIEESDCVFQRRWTQVGTVNLSEICANKRDPCDRKWRYSVLFKIGQTSSRARISSKLTVPDQGRLLGGGVCSQI